MFFMPLIKSVKNISTSGTSKIIPVTQEIKTLGLDVKDSVIAVLATPGSEEEYALDIASALVNPDSYYVNNRIMTSKDSYPNGQQIENRMTDNSFEDCEQTLRRMTAMQNLIDVMREYTKNKVSGPYAYYNNELHTFVARFDPTEIMSRDLDGSDIKDLISQLDVLKACLDADIFGSSSLFSVQALKQNFARALADANALLECSPGERDDYCKQLNAVWTKEINRIVYCDLFFVGLIVPFYMDDYPDYSCAPVFSVVPAPSYRMAKEDLQNIAKKMINRGMDTYVHVFGPYEKETECSEIVSYLRIKWKLEVGKPGDYETAGWVKAMVDDYNRRMGE